MSILGYDGFSGELIFLCSDCEDRVDEYDGILIEPDARARRRFFSRERNFCNGCHRWFQTSDRERG